MSLGDGGTPAPVPARRPPGHRRATSDGRPPTPAHEPGRRRANDRWTALWIGFVVVWALALVLASAPMLERQGASLWDPWLARIGAAAGTWCCVVLVARRIGGPVVLVASIAAVCAAGLVVMPRGWVLAAGAAAAAVSYGLLGMVMTRPARGLWTVREVAVATICGGAGLSIVSGFAVGLHPYRFRLLVLGATLVIAFAMAWRLGLGFHSLGRRGAALIVGSVVVLFVAVGYVQAVRHWGSSDVVGSLTGTNGTVRHWLWASPRPIEALVGYPALVWGAAVRNRRRQGWWMTAFGSLAAGGVATSLVQPSVTLAQSWAATGYDVAIGTALGLLLVVADRVVTGSARGARVARTALPDRPEPSRFAPLV